MQTNLLQHSVVEDFSNQAVTIAAEMTTFRLPK